MLCHKRMSCSSYLESDVYDKKTTENATESKLGCYYPNLHIRAVYNAIHCS